MNDNLVHQRENNEDTETFLQENIGKHENACMFLLKKMMAGERLSARTVMMKYGVQDRRLRDLEISGKCEKSWKLNSEGKRLYVEYFVSIPKPLSKLEVGERAEKVISMLKNIPNGSEQSLF